MSPFIVYRSMVFGCFHMSYIMFPHNLIFSMCEPAAKRARTGTPRYDEVPTPDTWTFTIRTTPKATSAYIANFDGSKVRFQLPRCRVPFGIQISSEAGGSDAADANKSRPNLELDVNDPGLVSWGRRVDDVAIEYISINSRELMRKEMRKDFVEQLFRRVIPAVRNAEYNPLLRTKITTTGTYATKIRVVTDPGSPTTMLRHRPGTLDDIQRGDDVVPVVEATKLWFANNSAGIVLSATHILVYKKRSNEDDVFTIDGVAGVHAENDTKAPVVMDATTNEVKDDPFL